MNQNNNFENEVTKFVTNGRYYVHFAIDNVLFDRESLDHAHGPYAGSVEEPHFNPQSIEALNLLIESLEKLYNVRLVVTSRRRKNLPECVRYLKREGLKYDKPIFCTPYNSETSRGRKIADFMKQDGAKPLYADRNVISKLLSRIHNNDFENYVVINSRTGNVVSEIPANRRITTSSKKSLTVKQVKDYLSANNIPCAKQPEMQDELSFEQV